MHFPFFLAELVEFPGPLFLGVVALVGLAFLVKVGLESVSSRQLDHSQLQKLYHELRQTVMLYVAE